MEQRLLVREAAAQQTETHPRKVVVQSFLRLRARQGEMVVGVRIVEERRAGVEGQEAGQGDGENQQGEEEDAVCGKSHSGRL